MAKRIRSPNYPAIGLREATDRLKKLWGGINNHPAPREVVLRGMGYSGASGKSLSTLSALGKYGLLQRDGEQFKITERGKVILYPQNDEERNEAIHHAASEPKLFAELNERYSNGDVDDDLICNYLVRKDFSPSAALTALRSYRETMEYMKGENVDDNSHIFNEQPLEKQRQLTLSSPPHSESNAIPSTAMTINPGQFRVSMTENLLVDISACKLNRPAVDRLIQWLEANKDLLPGKSIHENDQENSV